MSKTISSRVRFNFVISKDLPLILDKLESEENMNTYLKELLFADLYAHDVLITTPSAAVEKPNRDIYNPLQVTLRLKVGEDDDIITCLRTKSSKGVRMSNATAYVCSLIYHDLGYHDLAEAVYAPYRTERKPLKQIRKKHEKGRPYVHFDIRIGPDKQEVLAKLESVSYDPDYIKDLVDAYLMQDGSILPDDDDDEDDIPDRPYNYYRRTHGCKIRVEYEIQTENGFAVRDPAVDLLLKYETEKHLSSFICHLIYINIGNFNKAHRLLVCPEEDDDGSDS